MPYSSLKLRMRRTHCFLRAYVLYISSKPNGEKKAKNKLRIKWKRTVSNEPERNWPCGLIYFYFVDETTPPHSTVSVVQKPSSQSSRTLRGFQAFHIPPWHFLKWRRLMKRLIRLCRKTKGLSMRNQDGSWNASWCLLNEQKTVGERKRRSLAGELNWKLEQTKLSRHPKCQRAEKNSIQGYQLFI